MIETRPIVCLDSGVWIKLLVDEEPVELSEAAVELARRSITHARVVAPAFAWAEVGSVLRKKVRQGLVRPDQAEGAYLRFGRLPIDYIDTPELRGRAWEIARRFNLPTLYDAAFLACVESAAAPGGAEREFWTTDEELFRSLGSDRPSYVRWLGREQ